LASVLSGILYRLGGAAKKGDWLDILRNTKTRDWGCPLIVIGMMYAFGIVVVWWLHAIAFVLMWAALTTYWDDIFGYDNYFMHGFTIGLACVPYLFASLGGGFWIWFLVRSAIMCVFMGVWCLIFKNDIVEEGGRGAIIALTVPLFLI